MSKEIDESLVNKNRQTLEELGWTLKSRTESQIGDWWDYRKKNKRIRFSISKKYASSYKTSGYLTKEDLSALDYTFCKLIKEKRSNL